jgi:hypothetical protein
MQNNKIKTLYFDEKAKNNTQFYLTIATLVVSPFTTDVTVQLLHCTLT